MRGDAAAQKGGWENIIPTSPSPEKLETTRDKQPAWLQLPGRNIDLQLGLSILTAHSEHTLHEKAL